MYASWKWPWKKLGRQPGREKSLWEPSSSGRARYATAHAELLVIRQACQLLQRWRLSDATLYVTLEPCPMCAGAIWNARLGRVVYGAWDSAAGACGSQFNLPAHASLNFRTAVTAGVLEQECRKILQDFLKARR